MKINKKIISYITLFSSIFIKNIDSYALDNRYEFLSGNKIEISNSNGVDINEIEIFGNTNQNPSNLKEIESVGDLYTNELGLPILDSRGNKQYKINIVSSNNNLLDVNKLISGVYNYGTLGVKPTFRESDIRLALTPEDALPIINSKSITIECDKFKYSIVQLNNGVSLTESGWQTGKSTTEIDENTTHIAFNIGKHDNSVISTSDVTNGDILVYYSDISKEELYKGESIEIILPQQLQKLGDISDKLYWDKSKNQYIIEKNIENLILNGSEDWYRVGHNDEVINTTYYGFNTGYNFVHASKVLSDTFIQPSNTLLTKDEEGISIRNNSYSIPTMYIKVEANKLEDYSVDSFKKWLSINNVLVKYQLESPKYIPVTKYQKINLSTYENNTYVYCDVENKIQPLINITTDNIYVLAKESLERTLSNPNIDSISEARYIINLLNESILKDELQEELNSLIEIENFNYELLKKESSLMGDIYIVVQSSLEMSLSTNYIKFDDISLAEGSEKLNALNISIESSLPYRLTAELSTPIYNSDKTSALDVNSIQLKESSEDNYKTFNRVGDKILIKEVLHDKSDINHSIDFKIEPNKSVKADAYKASIQFEASQF